MPTPPTSPPGNLAATPNRDRNLAGLFLTWLGAAVAEVGLMVAVPTSAVHDRHLTAVERASLVAVDLYALALVIAIVGGVAALVTATWRARPTAPSALRIGWMVSGILGWAVVFLGATSWGLFWSVGAFLDRSAIAFWLAQPLQVFHWAPPALVLGIPPATVLATLILGWGVGRLTARMSRAAVRAVGSAVLLLMVGLAGALVGGRPRGDRAESVFRDEGSGLAYAVTDRYRQARRESTGAFAHALFDGMATLTADGLPVTTQAGVEVLRRPLLSMDEYLRPAQASRLHRWNVLVIVVESLRADALRAYGATRDIMPGVDALSREARVFRRAYTQASISADAMPCILSSNYSLRWLRQFAFPAHIDHPRVLLYDVLKALDYRVGFFSSSNEDWGGLINYWNTGNIDRLFHPGMAALPAAHSFDDALTVTEAIKWLDSDPRPFFLYVNMQSSHFPYNVPEGYRRRFARGKPDFTMTLGQFPRDKTGEVRDLYADSLAYIDEQLARLFAHLRAQGRWDDTVVVFTGDHGQAFYEHGLVTHGNSLFEEAVRVPLLVRGPGVEPGVVDGLAQHVDVAPSVLHVLGLPPHPAFQGADLFGAPRSENRSIYLMSRTPLAHMYGLVRGPYKLIYDAERERLVLYDLLADPGEQRDLATERPDVRERLAAGLRAWISVQLEYYASPLLRKSSYPPVIAE